MPLNPPTPPTPPVAPKMPSDVMEAKKKDEESKIMSKKSKFSAISNFTAEKGMSGAIIFVIVWFALGLLGFLTSLFCAAIRGGSVTDKTVGILTAMVMGPFYWIYFYFNKAYCTKK
jgi:hypothetical protein